MILKAYVVPHPPIILSEVGKGEEKKIQKTIDSMNYMSDEILKLRPDTIIITSPHALSFRDGFYIGRGEKLIGSLSKFGIFDVKEEVDVDNELAKNIMEFNTELSLVYSEKYDDGLDHGSLIPIRFIHKKYKDFKILLVGLSGLAGEQHYKLGKLIEQSVKNLSRRAVFIASGDLSHVLKVDGPYGFEKEGPEFDKMILDILSRGALEELFHIPEEISQKAAQCGLKSFQLWSFL